MIDIESVSSYEGSEGEYAGGQGKNSLKECLMRIYKYIKYHLYMIRCVSVKYQVLFFMCFHSKLLTKICSESDRKFCESKVLTENKT